MTPQTIYKTKNGNFLFTNDIKFICDPNGSIRIETTRHLLKSR